MTCTTHTLSHESLATFAASGCAMLPETAGVLVEGTLLHVWSSDAPASAISCAIEHVTAVWRMRKDRALAIRKNAENASAKCDKARTISSKKKAAEIASMLWTDYSRACSEVDLAEERLIALQK